MASNNDYQTKDITFPDQKIVEINLEHEMQDAYIEYAMSVIVGRALPDVRDGLKPVHRRIYSMYESGLTSDKAFKKSATCVGDVLGKYHPHGDQSVYDALVRLARISPCAIRWWTATETSARWTAIPRPPTVTPRPAWPRSQMKMLRGHREGDRGLGPQLADESLKEPRVIPSRFPNLLVNGSSGIAVGMTTNIPPHNLREVIDAAICVLDNPEAELDDLMEHIKGPDFPTRGIIMGRSGIRAAYATGKGHIRVRARTEMEEFGNNRTRIIVTELPYQVNKSRLVENIADQVHDKRLEGISGLRDESDGKKGMAHRHRTQEGRQSPGGAQPALCPDPDADHLCHRHAGSRQQPEAAQDPHPAPDPGRVHCLPGGGHHPAHHLRPPQGGGAGASPEGLLIAQDNIDEVIRIIRESYDNARERLMERFGLDEVQAQAILDMQLKRLQGLEKEKLEAEYAELMKKIAYYNELLSNGQMLGRPQGGAHRDPQQVRRRAQDRESASWRTTSTSRT